MLNTIDYVKIGTQIRLEREKFGMTRENFSEILDLSSYFLGQIERGERKMSVDTLVNVCECLHISMDSLFFEQIDINTNNNVLHSLIDKCSIKEINVVEALIKLILPHLSR